MLPFGKISIKNGLGLFMLPRIPLDKQEIKIETIEKVK